ncbi:hypothetical protein GOP47_0024690 [Adiantum capillus-veneris]|uniref:RRM domain-containing protein n=1 Tax=Adiantum capillus-veneris TaxID=13818 RepID=A0A9D4U3F0_ADICA|nr:hypothetical protein GOP47_0024690 [Adiantum capillus-veneris]
MDNDQGQGSFKLLRSLLGTIAGGLSSLASLPFGKRKKPEDSPLVGASLNSHGELGQCGDDLSKLYPDMELSETRKRARLSLDDVFEDTVDSKEGKFLDGKALEESSEIGLCETSVGFERASTQLDDVQYAADKMLDDFDVTAYNSDGVSHVSPGEIGTQHNVSVEIGISGHEEALQEVGQDSDDFLASFRRTLMVARKSKEQKRPQNPSKEESPRKKVRFGESSPDVKQPSETLQVQIMDIMSKKGSTRAKRKRVNVAEDKNEKKMKALTISEELVRPEGRTSTVDMSSILTRKRERADDNSAVIETATEEAKLQRVVFVENLPLHVSRKAMNKEFSQFGAIESMHLQSVVFQEEKTKRRSKSIGEADKLADCQSARIVFKDERSAKAAIAHNMKEFNGNCLRVTAAHAGVAKEFPAPVDGSWSIFVSNTPTNVKDEELFHLFRAIGSLELDVAAVKVIRDPQTGLSKGTAYVFFKTQADVNSLLSSRHTLKLRGRVLRISRALTNIQAERKSKQPRLTKHSRDPEMDDNISPKKRVKMASLSGGETGAKEPGQEGEQMLTRSRRGDTESSKQHVEMPVASSPAYTTRQVAASLGPHENLEESPETKRKRNEKCQRGISRSKKIRRT